MEVDHSGEYTGPALWDKLRKQAARVGRGAVEGVLQLYFALERPQTPAWAKGVIVGALGYFISPIDAIPDVVPVLGYTDDAAVIAAALASVAAHVDADVRKRAADKLRDWFGA